MLRCVPSSRSTVPRRVATALLLIVLLAALGAAAAGPAAAAPGPPPSDHPMSLDALRALINADPDGRVPGYFKTVLKGETIVEIPCEITAVVDGLLWDNTALIMFEASGPDIDRIGGIAAGMSGSPLFVDDVTDSLVGAVSYGDWFTTNGLGLATPVEYMSAIEDDHMSTTGLLAQIPSRLKIVAGAHALAEPVKTSGGASISRIVIARTIKQAGTIQATNGTAVMAPLFTVGIGGLSPTSAAFKHLAAKLEERGINVRAAGATGVYDTFETPLIGGAAVGAAVGYGDYWIAAMGTVTYAHDDVVAAFGHPFWGDGETSLILTNAWVHGVWSSSYDPYKIMTLGKIRGEITQDRAHGIIGIVSDTPPAMIDMTSTATLPSPGPTASAETFVPRNVPGIDWIAGEIAWGNSYMPVDQLLDGYPAHVSASTNITAVVHDVPYVHEYTVDRNNMADGMYGIGDDAWMVLEKLLSNPNGVAPAELISVDMTTDLVLETKMATLLDLEVPGGLHRGDNTVIATVRPYGQIATETREATLNIPAGAPLRGWVEAVGGTWWDGWWWSDSSSSCCFAVGRSAQRAAGKDTRAIKPPPTLADLVTTVQGWPQNNDLIVTFTPYDDRDSTWDPDGDGSAETRAQTPQVLYGWIQKDTSRVIVRPIPRLVDRGDRVVLLGAIEARGDAGTVQIYRVVPGAGDDVLLATVDVKKNDRDLHFVYRTPKIKRATTFLAVWSGNSNYLGDTGSCKVGVR